MSLPPPCRAHPHVARCGTRPSAFPRRPSRGRVLLFPRRSRTHATSNGGGYFCEGSNTSGGGGGSNTSSGSGSSMSYSQWQSFGELLRSYSRAVQQTFGIIPDTFDSIHQVQEKLREVGLESSNLVVGVDFTKSNKWTGKHSFGGRSLHAISEGVVNPYEQAIDIIGQTLSAFTQDNLIPCYGFGDLTTYDKAVFSFNEGQRPCNGFEEALQRYREIAPLVQLSGPTSFAPVIEAAVRHVEESGGQHHVLLIIADGQVNCTPGVFSSQEQATVDAIVAAASNYALSIVMVGVGDGPWDKMQEFDDALPQRNFDNFQFVNFNQVMASSGSPDQQAAQFALSALMEVPLQYRACGDLQLLGRRVGRKPPSSPKEPPPRVRAADRAAAQAADLAAAASPFEPSHGTGSSAASREQHSGATSPTTDAALGAECAVCLVYPKNIAFQCGHLTCEACAPQLRDCPICRATISIRIKLYV